MEQESGREAICNEEEAGIYQELEEEGVDFARVPWIPRHDS